MSRVTSLLLSGVRRYRDSIAESIKAQEEAGDDGARLGQILAERDLTASFVFATCSRDWCDAGRVVVTTDATTQALLGVTPHGPLTAGDWHSPWGTHAILMDPPIPVEDEECSISLVILQSEPGPDGEVIRHAVTCLSESSEIVSIMGSTVDMDSCTEDWPEGIRRAYRIAVGLNRLIQGAPSASRPGVAATRAAEVVDRGVSKKTQERSVLVRRLFVVDPTIAEACRAAVRKGVHAPSVRHLVRGHWRNQACGPKHRDYQLIWIQPHWRGALKDILLPVEVRVS